MIIILEIILLVFSVLSTQDWTSWEEVNDAADNKIEFSYRIVKDESRSGNIMYYRLKNGYNKNVCGAIYISYIKLDGSTQNGFWDADIKTNQIKEGNHMNHFDVASIKAITRVDIKYCDGTQLNSKEITKSPLLSFAVCDDKLPLGSHGPTGWCGPKRLSYQEAEGDAKAHNLKYSHQASVCTGDCPTCNAK